MLRDRSWRTIAALVLAAMLAQAAPAEERPLTRIAFGSCAHQEKPQPLWRAVLDYAPELFLFMGDNVYGDVTSAALTELQRAYFKAAAVDDYETVRERVPHLAVWDDHDYGRNDGGADFPYREQAKRLFLEFWDVPADDPRRSREGLYHARTFGPEGRRVQVILLDTRWFRSPLANKPERADGTGPYAPDPDPAKTMLGEAQWDWLRARLEEPAEVRLIVSSVQVLAEGHDWERWGNLPLEREKLLDLIAETGAEGVVFLSGDRHVGALYRLDEVAPYPLYEITSSGINMTYPESREPGPLRLGAVYGAENFGTIDLDWWARQLTLSVRGMNGAAVRRVVVPFADIGVG